MLGTKVEVEGWYSISMISETLVQLFDKNLSVVNITALFKFFHPIQLSQSEWKPDFGLPEFVPNWGATVTGARNFLIAYNINVLSTKEQAHRIALNIREQGRGKEQVRAKMSISFIDREGNIVTWIDKDML